MKHIEDKREKKRKDQICAIHHSLSFTSFFSLFSLRVRGQEGLRGLGATSGFKHYVCVWESDSVHFSQARQVKFAPEFSPATTTGQGDGREH